MLVSLGRTGVRRDTLVIYYSDHGETFLYRADAARRGGAGAGRPVPR